MSQSASSTSDRLQFGIIAGVFGAVVGAVAALTVLGIFALVGFPHHFSRWMVGFSTAFFFVVGVVRQSEAADTVADSLTATIAFAFGALGVAEGGASMIGRGSGVAWQNRLWWTISYFTGMLLLAWFA